jgi:hypothetical protein
MLNQQNSVKLLQPAHFAFWPQLLIHVVGAVMKKNPKRGTCENRTFPASDLDLPIIGILAIPAILAMIRTKLAI